MKIERRPTIVTPPEGCSSYLTVGKHYEVLEFIPKLSADNCAGIVINDDYYGRLQTNFPMTSHLNDQCWIVVAWSDSVSSIVDESRQYGFEFN